MERRDIMCLYSTPATIDNHSTVTMTRPESMTSGLLWDPPRDTRQRPERRDQSILGPKHGIAQLAANARWQTLPLGLLCRPRRAM
jgi:hypothetical protein